MNENNFCFEGNESILKIVVDKKEFFPEDTVSGTILMTLSKPISFFDIVVQFEIEQSFKNEKVKSCNILSEQRLNLASKFNQNNSQEVTLTQPLYSFPFTIKLDSSLPSSMELLENSYLFMIKYKLISKISSAKQYPISKEEIIFIKSKAKYLKDPLNQSSIVNVKGWGVKDKGTTILSLSYPKNNYRNLDTIPLSLTLDNKRGNLDNEFVKIELHKKVEVTFFEEIKTFDNILVLIKLPLICKSHEVKREKLEIKIEDKNIRGFESYLDTDKDNKNYFMESVEADFIKCDYYIKATCYFTEFVPYDSRPRVILPLWIISQTHNNKENIIIEENKALAMNQNLNEKEESDIEKAIKQSKIEYERMKESSNNVSEIEKENHKILKGKRIENENQYKSNVNNNSYNLFIKNDPLIDENNKNDIHNEYYDDKAKQVNQDFNHFQKQKELFINQKVFEHNTSIFNLDYRFENKLKSEPNQNETNGFIDINAL